MAICSLVLLLPYITSDIPCLNSLLVSTLAKPKSLNDSNLILSAASFGEIAPEATFSNKLLSSSLFTVFSSFFKISLVITCMKYIVSSLYFFLSWRHNIFKLIFHTKIVPLKYTKCVIWKNFKSLNCL